MPGESSPVSADNRRRAAVIRARRASIHSSRCGSASSESATPASSTTRSAISVADWINRVCRSATRLSWERTVSSVLQPAYSYFASNEPVVHVGLGDDVFMDDVRIRWVDGSTTEVGRLEAGEHVIRKD